MPSPILSLQLIGLHLEWYHPLLLFLHLSLTFQQTHTRTLNLLYTLNYLFKGSPKKALRALPKKNVPVLMPLSLVHRTTSLAVVTRQRRAAMRSSIQPRMSNGPPHMGLQLFDNALLVNNARMQKEGKQNVYVSLHISDMRI